MRTKIFFLSFLMLGYNLSPSYTVNLTASDIFLQNQVFDGPVLDSEHHRAISSALIGHPETSQKERDYLQIQAFDFRVKDSRIEVSTRLMRGNVFIDDVSRITGAQLVLGLQRFTYQLKISLELLTQFCFGKAPNTSTSDALYVSIPGPNDITSYATLSLDTVIHRALNYKIPEGLFNPDTAKRKQQLLFINHCPIYFRRCMYNKNNLSIDYDNDLHCIFVNALCSSTHSLTIKSVIDILNHLSTTSIPYVLSDETQCKPWITFDKFKQIHPLFMALNIVLDYKIRLSIFSDKRKLEYLRLSYDIDIIKAREIGSACFTAWQAAISRIHDSNPEHNQELDAILAKLYEDLQESGQFERRANKFLAFTQLN